MIPEAEDPPTRSTLLGTSSSPSAAFESRPSSTASNPSTSSLVQIHHHSRQQLQQQQQPSSAWMQYRYFVEAMHLQGQAFNRKLVIEAMFRGSDLVYSCQGQSTPCPS